MQQQNLTVSELARRSGVTQSTVDSVLRTQNTNPRIDTIHKMNKALNISVPEFFKHLNLKTLNNFKQKDLAQQADLRNASRSGRYTPTNIKIYLKNNNYSNLSLPPKNTRN